MYEGDKITSDKLLREKVQSKIKELERRLLANQQTTVYTEPDLSHVTHTHSIQTHVHCHGVHCHGSHSHCHSNVHTYGSTHINLSYAVLDSLKKQDKLGYELRGISRQLESLYTFNISKVKSSREITDIQKSREDQMTRRWATDLARENSYAFDHYMSNIPKPGKMLIKTKKYVKTRGQYKVRPQFKSCKQCSGRSVDGRSVDENGTRKGIKATANEVYKDANFRNRKHEKEHLLHSFSLQARSREDYLAKLVACASDSYGVSF